MTEVASAFVSLMPSTKGWSREIESQVGGEVEKSGGRVGKLFGNSMKVGAVAAVAAVGKTLYDAGPPSALPAYFTEGGA